MTPQPSPVPYSGHSTRIWLRFGRRASFPDGRVRTSQVKEPTAWMQGTIPWQTYQYAVRSDVI